MKRPMPSSTQEARQMTMAFDSTKTRGMSPQQREAAITALAILLAEAADTAGKEKPNECA